MECGQIAKESKRQELKFFLSLKGFASRYCKEVKEFHLMVFGHQLDQCRIRGWTR